MADLFGNRGFWQEYRDDFGHLNPSLFEGH